MPGRPFVQVPGPTNVPERILRAMAQAVLDHRGAEFATLTRELLQGLQQVFQTTSGTVVLFPGSGTAGWEAAMVNTLSPGDRVLAAVKGQFSTLFAQCARALRADFCFDARGVDVAICGAQKGLMLPPGAAILCVGPRALAAGVPPRSRR
ncbi:MAG: hypothetical protein QN175_10695 [Armatimonadota bacterium]|nr:hypothetical protein [Armatimonadota bacterium]MDR7475460.1 hypothetical protein [Armatimonadota bacterium]